MAHTLERRLRRDAGVAELVQLLLRQHLAEHILDLALGRCESVLVPLAAYQHVLGFLQPPEQRDA